MCRCERLVEETVSNEILDMCVDASAFANTYMREMFAALSQEALKFFTIFLGKEREKLKERGGNDLKTSGHRGQVWPKAAERVRKKEVTYYIPLK